MAVLCAPLISFYDKPVIKKKESRGIAVRSGQFEFVKLNTARWEGRDLYHSLLNLGWPQFAGCLFGTYLLINAFFASLYFVNGGCVAEMPPGSFANAFFFSVETLATVGYGHMYPVTVYGHLVVTAEIMVGMFTLAVVTGLIFVRFSRPTARFEYSRSLVISNFDGQPALMLRVANLRHQAMVEAEFRLMLMRNERVAEGEILRRFHDLKMLMPRLTLFPAALTLRHVIDEQSPLHGVTPETLESGDCRFVASIVCVDTVIPAPVQSQHDYSWREVQFGHRFSEIWQDGEDGRMTVDYGRLHDTEPVDVPRIA